MGRLRIYEDIKMFKEYLLENWSLILITFAFAILLKTTLFLDRKVISRMYALVAAVFAFSLVVFAEFYLNSIHFFCGLYEITNLPLHSCSANLPKIS